MSNFPTTPSRKEARIDATICTFPNCFVTVPTDQLEKHQQRHVEHSPLQRNQRIIGEQ